MKITVYKMHWYPTLGPNIGRQPHHHFTYLFYQLANALKKQYDDVTIVDLPYLETEVEVFGDTVFITDCEVLITIDDRVVLLSFSDVVSRAQQLLFHRNNPSDLLVWSNYKSHEHIYSQATFQIKACPYVARYAAIDMDVYYHFRQTTHTEDKFFFRGNYTGLPRNVIHSLLEPPYTEHYSGISGLDPDRYFTTAIQHRAGLSIAGAAEFCYRDVEYMAIGLPILRFEFVHTMDPPLIPNVHYISVPRIDTRFEYERSCGEENFNTHFRGRNADTDKYADAYYQRYLEVKNDADFLKFVADNARQYYEDYIHPATRTHHFLRLLNL
jgi:hypothetical protein